MSICQGVSGEEGEPEGERPVVPCTLLGWPPLWALPKPLRPPGAIYFPPSQPLQGLNHYLK